MEDPSIKRGFQGPWHVLVHRTFYPRHSREVKFNFSMHALI